jgi:glycyl-tRNA synthetase
MVSSYELTPELLTFSKEKKTIHEVKYVPSVIEPSFGIGRVLYAVLEHAFSQRQQDEQRCVMSFKPVVAPTKVAVFKLINHAPFEPVVQQLQRVFQAQNLATRVDSSSGSLGRRYARSDELGVPFAVTVDFQTLLDETVTLRERDSMQQIRLSIAALSAVVAALVCESSSWAEVSKKFMLVNNGDDEEEEDGDGDHQEGTKGGHTSDQKAATKKVTAPTVVQFSPRGSFSRPNPLHK